MTLPVTSDQTYARSAWEARLDVDYAARLFELHCRLYTRMSSVFSFICLAGGAAAVISGAASAPKFAVYAGLVVSIVTILTYIFRPDEKAAVYRHQAKAYRGLARRALALDLAAIDDELAGLRVDDPLIIDALKYPAYNAVVRSAGRSSYQQRLSIWEKVVCAVA